MAAEELSRNAMGRLRKLVIDAPKNEALFSCSVCYESLDKLVLWNSDDQLMQIRLHVYRGRSCEVKDQNLADISEAHNHRWNFSTTILKGGYHHTLYQIAGEDKMVPTMVRYEGVGSRYALHHSQYHSVLEEPNTVSLIVRGPVEKKAFQIAGVEGGRVKITNSDSLLSEEAKSLKAMTLADYERVRGQLSELAII